jgi:hypothetical protein
MNVPWLRTPNPAAAARSTTVAADREDPGGAAGPSGGEDTRFDPLRLRRSLDMRCLSHRRHRARLAQSVVRAVPF